MVTAQGRLFVTTSALAFEGDDKREATNWSQIADVEIFQDGIKIQKRTASKLLVHYQI
ncbi:hypothetical protein [Bartonella sp. HY038]|uniref:hypothetical protein n=1 Tax=Bartonella sp. HY038 TaxID=2759660 RepID=UPI0015FA0E1A|nr:hypothetical protein [Bartonella sp. HY038]